MYHTSQHAISLAHSPVHTSAPHLIPSYFSYLLLQMQDEHGEDMGMIIPPTGPNPYCAQHAAHQAHIAQQLAASDSEAAVLAAAGGPGAMAADAAAAAEAERLHLMMMVMSDQQGTGGDQAAGAPDLSKFVALSPPIPGAPASVPPLALGTTPTPPDAPQGLDPLSMLMAAAAAQQQAQLAAAQPPPTTHANIGSRPTSSRVSQAPNLPTVLEAPAEAGESPSVHAQAQRIIEAPEFTPEVTPVPEGEESQVEHIPVAGEPSGMMMGGVGAEQSEGQQQEQAGVAAEGAGEGEGIIPQPEVTPEATETGPDAEPSSGPEAPAAEGSAEGAGAQTAAEASTLEAAPAGEASEGAAGPASGAGEPSGPPETYAAAPKPVPYRHTAARAEVGDWGCRIATRLCACRCCCHAR
jgi:hypothetical protein